jgi:hypothetical protein
MLNPPPGAPPEKTPPSSRVYQDRGSTDRRTIGLAACMPTPEKGVCHELFMLKNK